MNEKGTVMTMTIQEAMRKSGMSIYALSKKSGVPYSTVRDICNNKTDLGKCEARTVYLLARALGVSADDLTKSYVQTRCDFEIFKSHICHRLKREGDLDFILNVVQSPDIREYFDRGWTAESLYLLAMLDYISRLNSIPLCSDFNDLRELSMKNTVYPEGILIQARVTNNPDLLREAYDNCIPEFKRANIIENEVRSVA